jgi:hypothetical protein
MAGLVPAIHVFGPAERKDVHARDKPGHDGKSEFCYFAVAVVVVASDGRLDSSACRVAMVD